MLNGTDQDSHELNPATAAGSTVSLRFGLSSTKKQKSSDDAALTHSVKGAWRAVTIEVPTRF